jgi:hypothetical protein
MDKIYKTTSRTFKGLSTKNIKRLVYMGYGDSSKTYEGVKVKPLENNTSLIIYNQGHPVAVIANEGCGGGYKIYDIKGNLLPIRNVNSAKKLKEVLDTNKIVFDKVVSLEKLKMQYKERPYGEDAKLSLAGLAKKRREQENATPLMDMDIAKNKVWVDKFMKSIPKLEKELKSILGYDLKANVKGANNRKYFNIDFTPEFFEKDLGVMKFALKKAAFYMYCNPEPKKEKIWFPVKLGWEHHSGGTNGGDIKNLMGKSIEFWYNTVNGDWEEDK